MQDIQPNEIFKPYDDRYFVSNLGRVWCTKNKKYLRHSGIVKSIYITVCIFSGYKNNRAIYNTTNLHRVIAQAFHPNPNNLPVVNHIDGNKKNNSVENLEWCTQQYNAQHAVGTGLRSDVGKRDEYQIQCVTCTRKVDRRYLRTDSTVYKCQQCRRNNKQQILLNLTTPRSWKKK